MSKRQLDEDVDMSDSSDESSSEDELTLRANGNEKESVTVDFVFSDPKEEHYHSIRQHVLHLLPSSTFDASSLANIITGQVTTGTMVCVDDEPDVYGFITALNLKRYKDENSIKQILDLITSKCPKDLQQKLKNILENKVVGLVVNRRMINLPYQLVPAMHSALHDDIEWAIQNEDTQELRNDFKMDYFMILAGCQIDKSSSRKPSGKKSKASQPAAPVVKTFDNFEEEFLEQVLYMIIFSYIENNVLYLHLGTFLSIGI